MGRTPCCTKLGLNRGPWTRNEDELLAEYILKHGEGGWRTLPRKAGLLRFGKSCRLRWMNYLRPDVKRGNILPDEEDLILRLHRLLGNRWSLIAGRIPGRTDNEIKNFWNTHLSKKLISQGIDPRTHKSLSESELYIHDNNSLAFENQFNPVTSHHSQDKYPQTAEFHRSTDLVESSLNIQAFNDTAHGASQSIQLAPPVIQDGRACKQHSCSAFHMNPTLIPHCNFTSEVGLQDHDASLYLRRNSTTNSYFVSPSLTESVLQTIPSFPSTVNEISSLDGFLKNFEKSRMQQFQVPQEIRSDMYHVGSDAIGEDDNSDIFSYLMQSFKEEDHFHDKINTDDAFSR